ncbi:2-keto-4-pentenoate hydratase/2-oxohepta-3-ene-1,7-dioic acid hydratase in catechol pathway [Alkalispirillum mobile]|uniref:2-keto-4-pentenoate hydratase/2-oxohepta-3-ene-1,7-dioic acid hydratase in catechol pathway n=1 Tax=Alkalispirillum mobile TaxID=85925 RepID=A0A498BZI1_9GAMM|nr:fumarylacetoacetate hydrolase family protein [Alkalispirillum mobile]RLK46300.1 2-keto-4-pentenoate hydratase/2-oxohepta-3-ene-1,7-dioic acid hydratase in catechol pathway [Alkalispirillum mobile]
MRIATVEYNGKTLPVRVADDGTTVTPLAGVDSVQALLEGGTTPRPAETPAIPIEQVRLLAPIPVPRRNIMCLGLNYADHAEESMAAKGRDWKLPEAPVVFTKATTSVTGPGAAVVVDPKVTEQLDWEVELGVVIGRGGRHIPQERALEHVFGYTVVNDLSARDLQFRHKQFFLGKSMDGSCPMGPWITTADAVPDPQALRLTCRVNGELKQDGHTGQMVFSIAETIATLSRVMTLQPGDVIATGTPAGVGFARKPPEYLWPGDVVECEIEGLGTLRNPMVGPTQ